MGFFSKLSDFFVGYEQIDEEFYDDLTDTLIMGDVGMTTAEELVEELKDRIRQERVRDTDKAKELLTVIMKEKLDAISTEHDFDYEDKKSVVLVVGVNGVGKTTSAGKLAARYRSLGRKVMLVAADTFRAAAIEQLEEKGYRIPDDISVTGFDDYMMKHKLSIGLTTIHVKPEDIARTAADLIVKKVDFNGVEEFN